MTRALLAVVVLAAALDCHAAERRLVRPFESDAEIKPANHVDDLVLASLRERRIEPANDQVAPKVRTSAPFAATATVCSKCADRAPSAVTTVQPSGFV